MNNSISQPKPHKEYSELIDLLQSRGMRVPDRERAERKLAQIGYYRLSGFSYPCRMQSRDTTIVRLDTFQPNTDFDRVIELYLFDKKLRFLILDAVERIEVHLRSVIAHELGREDPLAYKNRNFIHNPRNHWEKWQEKHEKLLSDCKEDSIRWHKDNNKAIPFWVAVEAWDFGVMSKYYKMLNRTYQRKVADRLGVNHVNKLVTWLETINILRNRCAHHTRIWNQYNQINKTAIPVLDNDYFNKLTLSDNARKRLYGMISVIWFLVRKIGSNSDWIHRVADVIDTKPVLPGCTYWSMGLTDDEGFPRLKFGLT